MSTIATLTLNPALDKSARVERIRPDEKLRCREPCFDPGGGGINVAAAIGNLGGEATAVWTCGGFVGRMVGKLMDEKGLDHRPIEIAGLTRENVSIVEDEEEQQFRFCMPGAELSGEEIDRCIETIRSLDPAPDYLVLSGSLPPGAGDDLYARVAEAMAQECRVVVDTSGPPLEKALEAEIFLIKPNMKELAVLAGREIDREEDVSEVAASLIRDSRVEVVLTSLGSKGAIVVTADGETKIEAPEVEIRNKTGAGDSAVGGMVLALSRGQEVGQAARYAVAAGSAAVMSEGSQLCQRENTEKLLEKI